MSLSVGMPGATGAADLDFNLDLVADNTPATAPQTRNLPPPVATDFDLDLDSPPAASMPSFHEAVAVSHPVTLSPAAAVPDFFLETPEFKPQLATAPPAVTSAAPVHDAGMLEFDLSSLSLDLEPATVASDLTAAPVSGDPLEVKFMLAEEFRVLGDSDGARALADEVVAKAKGPLKVKAQAFLNKLL